MITSLSDEKPPRGRVLDYNQQRMSDPRKSPKSNFQRCEGRREDALRIAAGIPTERAEC
jgi:hypothetical protein